MDAAIIVLINAATGGLALWIVLRRIDTSAARVWHLARQHRAQETQRAEAAIIEESAHKVGPVVAAIRDHEGRLHAVLRAQIADADARARAIERRASDAGVALDAASQLVRELRALVDELARAATGRTLASMPAVAVEATRKKDGDK